MTDIVLYDPEATDEQADVIREIQTVLEKLAAHGTRSQIADHLVERGHGGGLASALSCPVWQHVIAAVPDAEGDLVVGRRDWTLLTVDGRQFIGLLPEPVAAFVRRFDAEDYPALIASRGNDSIDPF